LIEVKLKQFALNQKEGIMDSPRWSLYLGFEKKG